MSESLPDIGVMIAPAIRYVVRIHDDVLYEMEKSFMRSGIAGTSIVSAYIDIVAIRLSIASVFQAEREILSEGDCTSFTSFGITIFISPQILTFFDKVTTESVSSKYNSRFFEIFRRTSSAALICSSEISFVESFLIRKAHSIIEFQRSSALDVR